MRNLRATLRFKAVLCGLMLLSSFQAQEVTAGVFGVVQDASGAVVPNAQIRMRNTGLNARGKRSPMNPGIFPSRCSRLDL